MASVSQALTSVALADGFVGVEHQYAQDYDSPLASLVLGNGVVTAVTSTGSPLVENDAIDANGLDTRRLERWPAVGANHGDVRLRLLGAPGRITAQGASTLVESRSTTPHLRPSATSRSGSPPPRTD